VCRLFGMSAGAERVHASFWLLDAPDSLQMQGRRNRDGTGLGFFDESGQAVVDKQPEAAYSDVAFIQDAKTVSSATFVAHVRIATTGELKPANCHPFISQGRIMAHNGGFEELDRLESQLGEYLGGVEGDTDSERFLALVSQCIDRNGGDVGAGITEAASWLAENVPLYSLNLVLVTETDMWALRYPDHFNLFVLHRPRGGHTGDAALDAGSDTLGVSSPHLAERAAIVVASEKMDESPDWRLMEPGEILHVAPDLTVESKLVLRRAGSASTRCPTHHDASNPPHAPSSGVCRTCI
jgi:predicted glutamine amidotransferase